MTTPKSPSLIDALIPIAALVVMLSLSVFIFGSDSSSGPNQIVLTMAAAIASIVAIRNGHKWGGYRQVNGSKLLESVNEHIQAPPIPTRNHQRSLAGFTVILADI